MSANIRIRPAVVDDIPLLHRLISGLAEFEDLAEFMTATEGDLEKALFGPKTYAEALIAEFDGRGSGFALFYYEFSTFLGSPGLYLEDLFVDEEARGKGIGKALLASLSRLAVERGCHRIEWAALNWNTRAIDFYERHGAQRITEWSSFELDQPALGRLAEQDLQ